MRAAAAILAAAMTFPTTGWAAEIWKSEAECLQRQTDLKRTEDFVTVTSLEMSLASIDKIPQAKLGGKIVENREKLLQSVKEARAILRTICDTLYP